MIDDKAQDAIMEAYEKSILNPDPPINEATNWKNDPWKARDEAVNRGIELLNKIGDDISPSESLFFYEDKGSAHAKKHRSEIGKKITALQKAVSVLEKV